MVMLSDDEDDIPLNAIQAQLTTKRSNADDDMDEDFQLNNMPNANNNNSFPKEENDQYEDDVEILPNARRAQFHDPNANSNSKYIDSEDDEEEADDDDDKDFHVNDNVPNGTSLPSKQEQELYDSDEDDVPLSTHMKNLSNKAAPKPSEKTTTNDNEWQSDDDKPLSQLISKIKAKNKKRKAKGRPAASSTTKRPRVKKEKEEHKPRKRATNSKQKNEDEVVTRKFEKPGQKRETPPENDPSRLFYESMYKEKVSLGKKSVLAETWMLRHGLLDDKIAAKVHRQLRAK